MKRALITGTTGKEGSYPAKFLLRKRYEVQEATAAWYIECAAKEAAGVE
jgi:GDP-D-mannose dehydratase